MTTKKIVDWYFTFKGIAHHKKSVTFTKEMLIDFIGLEWYDFFFDKKGKFIFENDFVIATARELGKTYVVVAIMIYLMINDPLANFVLTRKYGTAAGSFYEMFNQVLNDWQDKYSISFVIEFSYKIPGKRKKREGKYVEDDLGNPVYNKPTFKTLREITKLKGRGVSSLFSYGKTGDDKLAIFYNNNFDETNNQICFLRGADDADGSRGLSVNVGYVVFNLLEEYSQEVDKGKLSPDEQITRYASLNKSASRYATKMISKYPDKFPNGLRTPNLALANIWDPNHPYNVLLLSIIKEKEYREFVMKDPEKNFLLKQTVDGITFVRGTSAANLFLYPRGSRQRKQLVEEMKSIMSGRDDYKKAEVLGFTFPGFIKFDNPIQSVILAMLDRPIMELEDYKNQNKIVQAEYGTDPGLRDAWCSIPVYLGESKSKNKKMTLYINDIFLVDNKERKRKKEQPIPNPFLKQMQLEFWINDLKNLPLEIRSFLEVNMDMRATAIRDDFNFDIFPKNNMDAQCVSIPAQESHGYGLEQRPDILATAMESMVFSPQAFAQISEALKTLELYAEDKKQPHPRKGKVDIYDALCYGIVKLRTQI